HRTVLDPGFVKNSLAEEDVYETIHETALEEGQFPLVDSESLPPFATDIAARVITPDYLRNQTGANIDRAYAYLHGERETPGLAVNLTPAVERTDEAVAATVANTSIRELVETIGVGSLAPAGAPVNTSTVLMLTDGPDAYREARERFREGIREAAIDRVVNTTFQQARNDNKDFLLNLVIEDYNPNDYTEEEKEELVAENEADIKAELREQVLAERGDEIDQQINETLDSTRSNLEENLGNPNTGLSDAVDREAGDLLVVFVDGLAAEDLAYEEFRSRLDQQKAELGVALGDFAQSELEARLAEQNQVEDGRVVLTDQLPPNAEQRLSTARTAVGIVDILGIALPLAALALVALLWFISSAATAALWTGVAALLAGIPVFVGARIGGARLEALVAANAPASEFGSTAAQSLALAVVGLLLAAVGAALRLGLVELPVGGESGENGGAGGDGQ
ncbi:MAG: hypothetical protein ABEH77_01205, partial [Halobacteriaceae archaeon]